MRRAASAMAAIGLFGATGCTPPPDPVPPGRMTVPDGANAEIVRERARNFIQVVRAVEPVAEAECRRLSPGTNCDFTILVDDRPAMPSNAFQTRDAEGRPIIIFTVALIGEAQNADELAFVMAHEAAHHIAGHLDLQEQNAQIGAQVFGELASRSGNATPRDIARAQELGAAVGARTYSQDFELEADALGTVIAHEAGFDPLVGAQFFFRIPDPGDGFLSTHPPTAQRVAIVQQVAAELGITQ